jgi:membrane associated rhomboid family serine protease
MVAGLQVARRLRLRTRPGYAWVPIGGGLALFAMIGVAAGSDYWAHLLGLACGVAFGAGWAILQLRRGWRAPGWPVQLLLGALTIGIVAGCWLIAFRHRG